MTDDLIKRADEALAGVTPGPWWTNGRYSGSEMGCSIIAARTDCGPLPGNPTRGMVAFASAVLNTKARECEANARFIAAARELVPAMRDRIAELEAALERIAAPCAVSVTVDWRVMYEAWRAICVERVDIARAALGEKKE